VSYGVKERLDRTPREAKSRYWRSVLSSIVAMSFPHTHVLVLGTIDASLTQEVERILSNLVAGFWGSGSSYKPAGGN
jgi:hypothetical protein